MSDLYPFSVRSWSDIYQILRAKAEANRGTVSVAGAGAAGATFPRTTGRDAFALALVFDQAIYDHGSASLIERWVTESELLSGESDDGAEIYVGNRSLWDSMAGAAIELDRIHAAIPAPKLIDGALRELSIIRDEPRRPRNAMTTMVLTVFSEPTWKAMALRQLEFFRSLRGEVRDGGPFLPAVPCTRNADVLTLADYWTGQLTCLGENASDTFHRLLYSAWREVVHNVRHAHHLPPHETYAHNFEFWSALMLLATQSDASDAPAAAWAFDIPTMSDEPRNATPVDTGATLDFPAARTWDDAAQMQRDAFAKLRGEDQVTGRLITRVPRTTVADVRQLAAYWSRGLAKVGERHRADVSSAHVLERWRAAVAEVDRTPSTVDPSSVYAHNTDFWEAVISIAIQVAVTSEAPTRWQLVKETTRHAISDLPNTLKTAAQGLITTVLAKPLLYASFGLGGLALAVLLSQRPKHESKP